MPLTQIHPEAADKDQPSTAQGHEANALVASAQASERSPARPSRVSRRRLTRLMLRSLIAVLIGSLILRIAAQTMGQMVQFYLAEIDRNYFSISHTQRGFITASFFVTELIGSLVLGALSDRYGRKMFIILGPLLGAIAVQITSMTVAIWLLVVTRLLEGLSTASAIPATLGYISEATSGRPRLRARIVGMFEITLVGGIAIGAIVGGKLFKHFGSPQDILGMHLTSPAFGINGLIYLLSMAVFVWGLRKPKERPGPSKRQPSASLELNHYRRILRSGNLWRFVPAWLAINSIVGLWMNHSIGLMTGKDQFFGQLLTGNIAPDRVGNVFAFLAVLFALGVLGWSFILGRYRRTKIMIISTGGLFGTLLTVYGLNHLGSISSPLYYPLFGLLLISLLVLSGFTPAALTYLADVTETQVEDRGSIMGLYTVFLGIGQLVGTALGGQFAAWKGIDGLLLLSTIFGLITAATLIFLRRHEVAAVPA